MQEAQRFRSRLCDEKAGLGLDQKKIPVTHREILRAHSLICATFWGYKPNKKTLPVQKIHKPYKITSIESNNRSLSEPQ